MVDLAHEYRCKARALALEIEEKSVPVQDVPDTDFLDACMARARAEGRYDFFDLFESDDESGNDLKALWLFPQTDNSDEALRLFEARMEKAVIRTFRPRVTEDIQEWLNTWAADRRAEREYFKRTGRTWEDAQS